MEEKEELENVSEVLKESTLMNPDLTFSESTTYLDFLLSNAKTDEEKDEIKKIIDNYLEIAKDDNTEEEK